MVLEGSIGGWIGLSGVERELVRGSADLKKRGMNCPRLVLGDGGLGIWGAWRTFIRGLSNSVAGTTKWSTCWTRYQRSYTVKPRGACGILSTSEAREAAEAERDHFVCWCRWKVAGVLEKHWSGPGRMVTFCRFPRAYKGHH